MIVLGIDPSLTSTGIARVDTDDRLVAQTWTITSKGTHADTLAQRRERLAMIAERRIGDAAIGIGEDGSDLGGRADLAIIEGLAMAHHNAGTTMLNGLWWLTVHRLYNLGVPVVAVAPKSLKKYATGAGNAPKEAMVAAAIRRLPHVDTGDQPDRVDALWLAAMGADHLGAPLVDLPATHRAALDGVQWPTRSGAA